MFSWPEIITLIFAGIVALSTVVYAILTGILVRETRRLREVQTEPTITIFVKLYDDAINIARLVVQNIGLGPAYNISFELNPETQEGGEELLIEDFTKAKFFKTGLEYLGPNQQLESGYTQFNESYELKIKAVLTVNLRYRNAVGREYEKICRLDFSEFEGTTNIGKPPLYSIARSIKNIERDIGHFTSGFRKLGVNLHTKQDREREKKERETFVEKELGSKTSESKEP